MRNSPHSISIILPVYNALPFAKMCVESLYSSRNNATFQLVVVNNGSAPDVAEWLRTESGRHENFRVMHFDQPLGFSGAANRGVEATQGDYFVLLNSDTIVTDGWMDALLEVLDSNAQAAVVSPVTNKAGSFRQIDHQAESLLPQQAAAYASSIANRREVLWEAQRLVFFCVMIRRSAWDGLGGLDARYGAGYFEDDDFCLRARLAGYRLAIALNSFVFHHDRTTINANGLDHRALMERNELLFLDRASSLSRNLDGSNRPGRDLLPDVTVLVPVSRANASTLGDTLASLSNQTVCGFETMILAPDGMDLSFALNAVNGKLDVTIVSMDQEGVADQLNRGLLRARGSRIAYLSAGDVWYPYHLDLLSNEQKDTGLIAAHSAWGVWLPGAGAQTRGVVPLHQPASERLLLADWAPLLSWLHLKSAAETRFDPSLRRFAGWEFALRLSANSPVRYVPRVSCERRLDAGTPSPDRDGMAEAMRIMKMFPVKHSWQLKERAQFLNAVKTGCWEAASLLPGN
jgi:GT2 family glycosyltransferase